MADYLTSDDLPMITRVLGLFEDLGFSGGGILRATLDLNFPVFGDCLVSYLPHENDCHISIGDINGKCILQGYRLTLTDETTPNQLSRELLAAVQQFLASEFEDLRYQFD